MPAENANVSQPAAPVAAPAVAAPAAPVVAAPVAGEPAKPAVAAPAEPAAPILGADTKPAEPAKPAVVPEKYEFKVPQGIELDATQLEAFSPVFKELGLNQEQAQKLVDAQVALQPKLTAALMEQVKAENAKQNAEWAKQSREDPEFGGAKYEASVKTANAAFAQFASPALRKELLDSGLASHPEFVRLFWSIGQKLGESNPPANGSTPNAGKSTIAQLYPSMQPAH